MLMGIIFKPRHLFDCPLKLGIPDIINPAKTIKQKANTPTVRGDIVFYAFNIKSRASTVYLEEGARYVF